MTQALAAPTCSTSTAFHSLHRQTLNLQGLSTHTFPLQVLINVSPIEYGHVLLVPHALDCLPQAATASTLMQALHFAREADNPYFRVGYNSLGAYATINHLHFQVCAIRVRSAAHTLLQSDAWTAK